MRLHAFAAALALRAAACVALEIPLGYVPVRNPSSAYTGSKFSMLGPASDGISKRLDRTVDVITGPGLYFVTLEIGTPPRPFRVHLDTGSTGIFIPAVYTECATCDVHYDLAYSEALSSTGSDLACADPQCAISQNSVLGTSGTCLAQMCSGMDSWTHGTGNQCQIASSDSASGCSNCALTDTCRYKGDGMCDDGSDGGQAYCAVGTDRQDCGDPGCCASRCCSADGSACGFAQVPQPHSLQSRCQECQERTYSARVCGGGGCCRLL